MRAGTAQKTIRRILDAQGLLPYGARGDMEWDRIMETVEPLYDAIARKTADSAVSPVNMHIRIDKISLHISADDVFESRDGPCYIRWHPASLKAKGIVDTWLRHVLLSTRYEGLFTYYYGKEKTIVFTPFADIDAAMQYCIQIEGIYNTACSRLISFLPGLSYPYAEKVLRGGNPADKEINKLRRTFYEGEYQRSPQYSRDIYNEFVYRHVNLFDETHITEFQEFARTICLPLLQQCREDKNSV
jgi:exonuclease V gamma subunit